MNLPRKAGILLHPTSLPSPHGMGDMGPAARDFVQRLADAGQTYWQMLPLGPTGYADSPYQSPSTFAGNAMLISFEDLAEDGLLDSEGLERFPEFPVDHVDYGSVLPARRGVLDKVCRRFSRKASDSLKKDYKQFCKEQADWLNDYALYVALKEEHDLTPWTEWPVHFRDRDSRALDAFSKAHRGRIRHCKLRQFLFNRQWTRLRETASEAGVQLIGDLPIFVAHDSADVWANRDLFFLKEDGSPNVVAGVPPDYFSSTGQLWGNPLYKWTVHQETGYAWWFSRLAASLEKVDIVRIDHFRGFSAYWEVPAGDPTAENGTWVDGPGHLFFNAMQAHFGDIPVIAEDLGVITPDVDALRDDFDLPGMRILHFSFSDDLEPHLKPDGFPENTIVYTGTHDNDTTQGWFWREPGGNTTESAEEIQAERDRVLEQVQTDGSDIHWDLIAFAHKLNSCTAIVPLQDIMGLGSDARMNVPGNVDGNWDWRFTTDQLREEDLRRLRDISEWSGRL